LPELVDHVLARLAGEQGRPVPSLSREAQNRLASYPFPGNVRELENILERALAFSEGSTVTAEELQLRTTVGSLPVATPGAGLPPGVIPGATSTGTMTDQLADLERTAILQALEKSRWNRTAAAQLLGLTFRQLRYRIAKLGLVDSVPPDPR
jgi:two-component system response regulator PilR (NtrC family)